MTIVERALELVPNGSRIGLGSGPQEKSRCWFWHAERARKSCSVRGDKPCDASCFPLL